jgi:hypothetical protein
MAFMSPPTANSGEFVPILSYNAVSGRLTLRDRTQNVSGEWEAKETDITNANPLPTFAVDFGRLDVGWVFFLKGSAPLWALVPYGQAMPERPPSPGNDGAGKPQNYRQGFRVPVAGNAIGGVRELAGQSAALINGLNELHSAYEAAPEAAMGKIPVVRMTRTDAIKSGQATNYQPVFEVVTYVDRPDVLGPRTVPAPRAQASAQGGAMTAQAGAARAAAAFAPAPVAPMQAQAAQPEKVKVMADSEMPF